MLVSLETIPDRDSLIQALHRGNQRARAMLVLLAILAVIAGLSGMSWSHIIVHRWYALLVCSIVSLPSIFSFFQLITRKKKEFSEINSEVTLGFFTRDSLVEALRSTVAVMKLPAGSVRAYLVRDKQMNAFAISIGAEKFFPSLNAISVNRSTLHCLSPEELPAVIAHEIAHIRWFPLLWDQWYFARTGITIVLSLFFWQLFPVHQGLSLLAPCFVCGLMEWIGAHHRGQYAHTLEYLCDDAGAQVIGVPAAIGCEYKMGARAEAYLDALFVVLKKKAEGVPLSLKEVIAYLEEEIPFGEFDPAIIEEQLRTSISKVSKNRERPSLVGFLHYLGIFESLETKESFLNEIQDRKKLKSTPKLLFSHTSSSHFSEEAAEKLVRTILESPNVPLFHLTNEESSENTSHPGVRERILYLWKNRAAIEHASKQGWRETS
jgi:Zn-dependent protease with chaperone function